MLYLSHGSLTLAVAGAGLLHVLVGSLDPSHVWAAKGMEGTKMKVGNEIELSGQERVQLPLVGSYTVTHCICREMVYGGSDTF